MREGPRAPPYSDRQRHTLKTRTSSPPTNVDDASFLVLSATQHKSGWPETKAPSKSRPSGLSTTKVITLHVRRDSVRRYELGA